MSIVQEERVSMDLNIVKEPYHKFCNSVDDVFFETSVNPHTYVLDVDISFSMGSYPILESLQVTVDNNGRSPYEAIFIVSFKANCEFILA